jgi:predicted O-methyltransferase YrrM
MRKIISRVNKIISGERYPNLARNVIGLNSIHEAKKVFGWTCDPVLSDPVIFEYSHFEDVNERRIRDAESIGVVMRNAHPLIALEIGTAEGHGTVLMAENAPNSKIYTVNIPPEEIESGKGGVLTTFAPEREKIGSFYRSKGLQNITQIYANTATWAPDIGVIDVAFIDGCHDSDFVYNDTKKITKNMKPGSFILWHDFNIGLMKKFGWIDSVCQGVEWLYDDKIISGPIFQIRDSWVGIYRVQ